MDAALLRGLRFTLLPLPGFGPLVGSSNRSTTGAVPQKQSFKAQLPAATVALQQH